MDKRSYNESVCNGLVIPQELVLHSKAVAHKECKGLCFTSWLSFIKKFKYSVIKLVGFRKILFYFLLLIVYKILFLINQ